MFFHFLKKPIFLQKIISHHFCVGKDNLFHRKKAHFQEGKNSNKGIFTKSRFFELMLLDFLSSKKDYCFVKVLCITPC